LYDGEKYLLERYRSVVFTPASQARLKDRPTAKWKGLGLGVSQAHEHFMALPAVVDELSGIIHEEGKGNTSGVLPGTIKLDAAFTAETMLAALRQRYPVVHIASHFQFQPGNETASFYCSAMAVTWRSLRSRHYLMCLAE
jgi:CHAT domain-containing protein